MKASAIHAIVTVLLAGAAVAYAEVSGFDLVAPQMKGASAASSDAGDPAVQAHGRVRGLYPGIDRRMPVKVESSSSRVIRVLRVSTRVKSRTPGCESRNVVVRPYTRQLNLQARQRRTIRVNVRMRRGAPDACQDVRFRLRFKLTWKPAHG